jgi:hypothetical protein
VLTGLYDKNGVLVINAELVRRRPAARGWQVSEIAARFNSAPDEGAERQFRDWVAAVPGAVADETAPARLDELPPVPAARRRAAPRLAEHAGPALGALARQAWEEEVGAEVIGAFATLAGTAPDAALGRLRRMRPGSLADACRRELGAGAAELEGLWTVTGVRPLRTAVAALDQALRDRFGQLSLLLGDPPLPKSLRRLVRLPAIADAYALDLAAREVRRAIGQLTIEDDPVIAGALADRVSEPLLCALTVMITCRAPAIDLATVAPPRNVTVPGHPATVVIVPGYPATALGDEAGPWQRALPEARELGADPGRFRDQVAEHGLRVPVSWLAAGGWTALWGRAHRRR